MLRPSVIYRFLLNGFLIWIVLTLVFLAIPSPIVDDDGSNLATTVLRSSKRLTRVYETGEYYPRIYGETYGAVLRAHEANKEWFMLDFQLDPAHKNLLLHDQQEISLTAPAQARDTISEPFVINGRAANVDGLLGLHPPWFPVPDALMLAWQAQRTGTYLELRTRWVDENTLEIWPDAQSWLGNETDSKPVPPNGWNNVDIQPMLTIRTAHGKFNSAKVPHPPLSMSPTSTLLIRQYLLSILAPTAWLVYVVFCLFGMTIGIFTNLITLAFVLIFALYVVWVGMGRPSREEYVERMKDKWADGVAYVRPLAPWRRRAPSVGNDTNAEKVQEEGKAFPV